MHLVGCEKHSEYVKHGKSCVTNDILMSTSVDENTSPDANILKVLPYRLQKLFSLLPP